jgi:hypothetical protein
VGSERGSHIIFCNRIGYRTTHHQLFHP